MKKSFSVLALIILCVLFSSMYYIKSHYRIDSPETTLVKAFNHSGAKIVCNEIYFWARIGGTYKNFSDLEHLAEKISNDLQIIKNSTFTSNTDKSDLMDKIEVKGVLPGKQGVNISIKVNKKTEEKIISGTITQDLSNSGLEETSKKASEVLKKYKLSAELNTCIIGNYSGKLNDEKLNDIAGNILKEAEAKKIEGMRDERLISVSAYSPNISDSIRVNGKKVNINLAIRYNSYENKTYIWLATPVITKEY